MAKVNSFLCVGYLLSALQQTFSMLYRILGLQDYCVVYATGGLKSC